MSLAEALAVLELAVFRLVTGEAPWPVRARRVFRPLTALSVLEPHALPADLTATLRALCADVRAGAHHRDPAGAQAVVMRLLAVHAAARACYAAEAISRGPEPQAAALAC